MQFHQFLLDEIECLCHTIKTLFCDSKIIIHYFQEIYRRAYLNISVCLFQLCTLQFNVASEQEIKNTLGCRLNPTCNMCKLERHSF